MAAGNREVIASTIFKPVLTGPVLRASMRNIRGIIDRLVPTKIGPGHYRAQIPAGDVDELLTSVTGQAESANGPRVVNTKLTRGGGNVLVDIYLNQINPALGGLGGGGGGGLTAYGEIFMVLPGDNVSVAVNAPVPFPNAGVTAGGVVGALGSSGIPSALLLPLAGDYQVDWMVSAVEPGQLALFWQPGGVGPWVEIPPPGSSTSARATGTSMISGTKLITTPLPGTKIELQNFASPAALTIAYQAGSGTEAMGATFSAKMITSSGGPPPPPIPVYTPTDDADFVEVTLSRLPL